MKRIIMLIALAVILVSVFMFVDKDLTAAEKPLGGGISGNFKWTTTVDSTSAVQRDTNSTPSGSSSKIFRFTELKDYSKISGYFMISYVAVDTGTGGVAVDTTKDTVITRIYTADDDGTPNKLVFTDTAVAFHVTASVVNTDYIAFDVSDSTQWGVLYFEIISSLQDSVYTKARLAAGIDWNLEMELWAKP